MLPDWLLWLLPVPLATGAAIAWASWRTRRRGPQDPAQTVRDHERFRAAMSTPLPRRGSGPGVEHGGGPEGAGAR